MAGVGFAGTEHYGRPVGLVGAVGIVLGLEADGGALGISYATLAFFLRRRLLLRRLLLPDN